MAIDLQVRLFGKIINQFPKRMDAMVELEKLLKISRDGVYRRVRGDTVLKPSELEFLARHFQFSLDSMIFGESDTVFFSFNGFSGQSKSFNDYLQSFIRQFDFAKQFKEKEAHFFYASTELPLFQSCFFPRLLGFKLYVWGLTVLGYDNLNAQVFNFDQFPAPILETSRQLEALYLRFPSTEIWGTNVMDNTLNQIEYYYESGHLRSIEDALMLCDELTKLTHHMQQMAAAGTKFTPGKKANDQQSESFTLYYNEMIFTGNTLLAITPQTKALFTSLSNPHFLRSNDTRMCDFMHDWFQRVLTKSNAISVQAEKQRHAFFNSLRTRIEETRQRIQKK